MGTASLILSIIALLVSFSFFKDLSLILAVLGIVLGAISLFKKKNKGMCVVGIILAVISLITVFSEPTDTETTSSNPNNNVQQCTVGDTITVKNTSGDDYTLQITSIKETKERNEYSDKNPKQVFVIDYTYTCNKASDGLYVSDMNFKIIDENGEIGETYPVDVKDPQEITAGTTCKAQMAFGINNKSQKIKLQFFDNMFDGNPTAIYELDIK